MSQFLGRVLPSSRGDFSPSAPASFFAVLDWAQNTRLLTYLLSLPEAVLIKAFNAIEGDLLEEGSGSLLSGTEGKIT